MLGRLMLLCSTAATFDSSQLPQMARDMNETLDAAMGAKSFAQNRDKGVTIARTYGQGSLQAFKQMGADPSIGLATEARYLGPIMDISSSVPSEDSFAFYSAVNADFTCTSTSASTTNFWFREV